MECLRVLSELVPGEITLNQIRVLQYVVFTSTTRASAPCQKEICAALELSSSTVSRATSMLLKIGILKEVADPADDRKRLEIVNNHYPELDTHVEQVKELVRLHIRSD